MSNVVIFKVDGGQHVQYELSDVAVPPVGAEVTIDGDRYSVENVDYTYSTDTQAGSMVVWVTSRRFSGE